MEIKRPAPFQVTLNHFCVVVQWLIKQLRCRTNYAPVHCCIQNAAVTICTTSLCLNVLSSKVFLWHCIRGIAAVLISMSLFPIHDRCFGVSAFVKLNVWFFTFLLWFKRKHWGFVWSIMQANLHILECALALETVVFFLSRLCVKGAVRLHVAML